MTEPYDMMMMFSTLSPDVNGSDLARDVEAVGCFGSYNTIACVREAVLSALTAATGLLCIARLIKSHMVRHHHIHLYIVFYCAAFECMLLVIHWLWVSAFAQLDFAAQYLKLVQFLAVCHFHWTLAARILHLEYLSKIVMPAILASLMYFTTVVSVAIIVAKSTWTECLEPWWLMLSAPEFITVQFFFIAGIYITRKLNRVSMMEDVKKKQKLDLWSVIVIFELSATCCLVYDAVMQITGNHTNGCSSIFLVKFMLPLWVMLYVFQPTLHLPPVFEEHSEQQTHRPTFNYQSPYQPLDETARGVSPAPTPVLQGWETEANERSPLVQGRP
ncbi:PREDICTED: uncharacterized protein LOC106814572 isoform X2 [Priapulus caudatus]|uniref:Uncharacterized protein LOC106814572 isoform X2 n=1 Tax=Priapulus caudatus TaxID=37621 RepID=A0ABM1EQC4_PRICU|nr:PREDICTED: uncharacterized protein LOC106814572 isoform X2 [Priapulus caudatus]